MPETDDLAKRTDAPQELSVADALAFAIHIHRCGGFTDAEILYRRILEAAPDNADATHFLGVLLHQRDRSDAAIEFLERSIALEPAHADYCNNLGNVLVERGRFGEAKEAYRQALALCPGNSEVWNNLGAVLRALGQPEEAEAAYLKAIELNPEAACTYNNYGNLLSGLGRTQEAVAFFCKAVTLMPGHPDSRRLLGIAYYTLGQIEAATEVYRGWLKEEPENPIAQHMLASCSGVDVPQRASDEFIVKTFDSFAGSFDQKLESLSYCAPRLMAEAVAAQQGVPRKNLKVLDAGCGTGLCGPLIAPYAARLTGVDLSPGMLAVARTRKVYDELVTGELSAYLTAHAGTFDLIVSADTLVYFGELQGVFAAAAGALLSRGLLVFTVEEAEGPAGGFRINPHGRYSHSRAYVAGALQLAGFAPPFIDNVTLRMESGSPVAGLVVTARLRR
jgi:predicted TPR repeat methyltransferase